MIEPSPDLSILPSLLLAFVPVRLRSPASEWLNKSDELSCVEAFSLAVSGASKPP